jgi:hypothetical protein
MALYGAICILQTIWVPLCIVIAVMAIIGGVVIGARWLTNRW